ncbi:MAG: BamA/TamA family outer membrane protein [Crocinitomicaceae bacterium]|nr:BamA/TamA family outer membrane protein [Crocinitomicaceae bacterium]
MSRLKHISFLLISIAFILSSCKQTKYVPEGKYLLKKNNVVVDKCEVSKSEFSEVIKQQPNYKTFGVKLKLAMYNAVDSAKVADKRIRKNDKLKQINQKRRIKEKQINEKRIAKAKSRGKEWYTKKVIPLKDTINPKLFFREWLKYKFGEPPVVFDSTYFDKSIDQLAIFLRKKGYYYGKVTGDYSYKDNKKVVANFYIHPGSRYYIDSVYITGPNLSVNQSYSTFIRRGKLESLKNQPFDSELLNDHRDKVARLMRDEAYFGFNYSSIDFIADTTKGNNKVTLGVRLLDRLIKAPDYADSFYSVPYTTYLVKDVHFHILDTSFLKNSYSARLKALGIQEQKNSGIITLDTLVFNNVYLNRSEKKKRGLPLNQKAVNPLRVANFYYNGKMLVRPGVLETQNYLENDNYYKEYYLERSYTRLLQLDLFSSVKPQLVEIKDSNKVEVHYYLTPAKRQYFGFEPKFTNSNGFLGLSASINYSNRNIFRGAEKLTFSLSGGFESQPPIFDESIDGKKIKKAGRSFNTFEIEPGVKLELPGIFPFRSTVFMAKRQRAKTIITTSFNFQNRTDFKRRSLNFGYLWRFYGAETQIFQIGFPTTSSVKYVVFNPSENFQNKLIELNDVFLFNTYSDQFIWQDWKLTYEYNSVGKKIKKFNGNVYFKTSFDPAGNFLSAFNKYLDTNALGQKTILGLGYSQFLRLDNEVIYAQPIGKSHSFNFRFLAGAGMPYGNSRTSLPYDYSFFGGGANDNRGWRSRALGPGVYKYYLDPQRTATQIGDIRIAASAEIRFTISGFFKGALFVDAGNIWTWKNDINRPGAQFSKDWYKQLAVSSGIGLRLDFDFFVMRLDLGLPLSNPSLPKGSQWIFQSRQAFKDEVYSTPGIDLSKVPKPFIPILHFGIGYPF